MKKSRRPSDRAGGCTLMGGASANVRIDSVDSRPQGPSLRDQMRRGLAWKMASQLVALVSRAALTVVLAHLLVPTEFGLAGMVLVFCGVALILTDFGLSGSLVQFDSLTEE